MKQYIYVFALTFVFFSCSSEDGDNPNNNPPGIFSANALGTAIDSGNVEWTEAIDTDEDAVTYAIFLEGSEIASGITSQTYDFSGLEPDTIYQGYVEARDGNGGTSTAEFDFVTDPELLIFNVDASWWIKDQYPEAGGLRTILRAGFIIPYYENATHYQIEILDYGLGDTDVWSDDVGSIFTWTNESHPNVGPVFANQTVPPGDYGYGLTGASINIMPTDEDPFSLFETVYGEARVTITIGD